jgi:hypothetical protein
MYFRNLRIAFQISMQDIKKKKKIGKKMFLKSAWKIAHFCFIYFEVVR